MNCCKQRLEQLTCDFYKQPKAMFFKQKLSLYRTTIHAFGQSIYEIFCKDMSIPSSINYLKNSTKHGHHHPPQQYLKLV